jgi:plastocyanin
MTGDQTGSRYIPAALTIKQGDAVRWTMITEPPHNVAFWSDSIPAGGATALQANMTQTMGALTGPFLMTPNQTYTISFAGVPPGVYKYYCVPHIAAGMKGVITVQ